jgi:Fe-S-cluster containining protein
MNKSASEYDCGKCGACCVNTHFYGDGRSQVDLSERDGNRLARAFGMRKALALTTTAAYGMQTAPLAVMRSRRLRVIVRDEDGNREVTSGEACTGLRGIVGQRCWCSIYDARPDACRKFKPGGEGCLGARREIGL